MSQQHKNTTIAMEISPLDLLFFRNGKPFSKGSETWADSVFPPSPSVFFGALKALYATHNNWKPSEINEKSTGLRVSNITLKKGDNYYFPAPLDLVSPSEERKINDAYESKILNFSTIPGLVHSNLEDIFALFSVNIEDEDVYVEEFMSGFVNGNNLALLLAGVGKTPNVYKLEKWLKNEPKIGNARDSELRTVRDSMLYRVDMKRLLDGVKIYIEYEAPENSKIPNDGFIKLGGEGKAAKYKIAQKTMNNGFSNIEAGAKYVKLYVATPTIFIEGWKPLLKEKLSLLGEPTLIAAKIGRSISIGGFNMQDTQTGKQGPKPMYKAIPAGSIYIYEATNELIDKLANKQGISISDYYEEQGFGIAYFGQSK